MSSEAQKRPARSAPSGAQIRLVDETPPDGEALSHNLNGQKLGRKGRVTRERILSATREVLAETPAVPISLSAVARRASLGMTSLYVYFNDLTELLLAVLEPVMATAEDDYVGALRRRWPDETLHEECLAFATAFYAFWERNARILHLRNSMADQYDRRMMMHRVRSAQPIIRLLVEQMDQDPDASGSPASGMATVLYTGIERVVTISTDASLREIHNEIFQTEAVPNVRNFLRAEARLLEIGIREFRAKRA
ncbi:MAG: TetR/AcrR family transcriptional regulator [Parvularculaceae bacterium]|nr:TetR/AcrR family transcriptional regulator [Parvularculaceae bacterium]